MVCGGCSDCVVPLLSHIAKIQKNTGLHISDQLVCRSFREAARVGNLPHSGIQSEFSVLIFFHSLFLCLDMTARQQGFLLLDGLPTGDDELHLPEAAGFRKFLNVDGETPSEIHSDFSVWINFHIIFHVQIWL